MWAYKEGASFLFPDKWEKFIEPIPNVERGDLLSAYHRRLVCTCWLEIACMVCYSAM